MSNTGCRYHARSAQGVEYTFLELHQLQELVDGGSLGFRDEVRVVGDQEDRWFMLGQVEGLRVSPSGSSESSKVEYWSDAAPVRRGLPVQTFAMATTLAALSLFLVVIGLVLLFLPGTGEVPGGTDDALSAGAVAALIPEGDSGVGVSSSEAGSVQTWYERHHRAVPIISAFSSESQLWYFGNCSSFTIVHDGRLYLVTNRHCIDDSTVSYSGVHFCHFSTDSDEGGMQERFTYDGEIFPVNEFLVHPDGCDVAVCDVTEYADVFRANDVRPLQLADPDDVPKGADLFWVGHPGSGDVEPRDTLVVDQLRVERDLLKVTRGEVSTLKREALGYAGYPNWPPADTYVIVTTGTINAGNSGGPMMRLSDGRVVGICSAGMQLSVDQQGIVQGVQNRNMAVRSRHIIETIRNGKRFTN